MQILLDVCVVNFAAAEVTVYEALCVAYTLEEPQDSRRRRQRMKSIPACCKRMSEWGAL